ncbi:hypothetical protein RSOL_334610, partial [Rhizoctonia solani AG-3 Rhs1AP]
MKSIYRDIVVTRASRKLRFYRWFMGLRWPGYLNELDKVLPHIAATLDVNMRDLGILPKESAGLFGKVYTWTTTLDEERPSSDHTVQDIDFAVMTIVKDYECRPGLHYVLIVDSDAMAEVFGNSNFTARYSSALGWGLVVALRGYPSYNQRVWLFTLSERYDKAFFAMLMDWDPYSMDVYTTLRTGSPSFLAENPHLAIRRLHFLGPTYKELKSNGGKFRSLESCDITVLDNLLAYRLLPSECKSELKTMKEHALRSEADTHKDIIRLASRSLLAPKQSNALFPESGDLGVLHVPVPEHEEDFELDLELVVPADLQFDKDAESGVMTLGLTHTDTDGCRTILERAGEKFMISKCSILFIHSNHHAYE